MPISDRARHSAGPGAVKVSRMNLVWPVTIVLAALMMFVLFWQTTLALALAMAVATLLAGGILLRVMYGTSWIMQLRHLLRGKNH
jgi:uncharacterized integral membrane protein